jgi:hypothetical protein
MSLKFLGGKNKKLERKKNNKNITNTRSKTGEYLSKKDKHIYINRRVFIKEGRAHLH